MNIEAIMSEYIKGFDAGCDFIVREIELYQRKNGDNDAITALLAYLQAPKETDVLVDSNESA
jgi:hypothetical protein